MKTLKLEQFYMIAKLMRFSLPYLFGNSVDFEPSESDDVSQKAPQFQEWEAMYLIFDVLNRCAVDDGFRNFQVQISRIIVSNLAEIRGFSKDEVKQELKSKCSFTKAKIDYICDGAEHLDKTLDSV